MVFASWTFIIFIIFGNVCYGQRARSKVSFVDNLIFSYQFVIGVGLITSSDVLSLAYIKQEYLLRS